MIRKATKKDAKDIVRINVNSWKVTYRDIFPKEFLDNLDSKNPISIKKCKENIDEYIIYEQEGKVVAMARYGKNKKEYDDSYAEIYMLYVDCNYIKQGIGKSMVNYIFNELKGKYKYLLISVLQKNNANEFYKKIGGKLIGENNFLLMDKSYLENVYEYKL